MPRSSIFSFDTIREFEIPIDKILMVALAIVLTAEVGLRVSAGMNTNLEILQTIKEIKPQGYFPPPHIFNREVGFLYRPHHRGRFIRTDYDAEMITNEHGFHSAPCTKIKPQDVYRVALIGDSMLAAIEVSVEQTWAYQLQKNLKPVDGRRVEIINFGMDGYLPWNISKLLELKVMDFHPDAVVLWCNYERFDIGSERYRTTIKNTTILEGFDPDMLLQHAALENRRSVSLRRMIPRTLYVSRLLNYLCKKVAPPNIQRITHEYPDTHNPLDLLSAMKESCNLRGVPLGVFYREHTPIPEQDKCRQLGIPTWSDVEVIEDYSALSWPHDAHFDIEGNATYAEKIAPVFQEMLETLHLNDKD